MKKPCNINTIMEIIRAHLPDVVEGMGVCHQTWGSARVKDALDRAHAMLNRDPQDPPTTGGAG
jgi:hypothetical protein